MPSSRSLFSGLAAVLFTGAPILVLLVIIGGLYAADRGIRRSDDARVAAVATEAAALTEKFLESRAEALRGFRAMFAPGPARVDEPRFAFLVETLDKPEVSFQRLWVTDAEGIVRADTAFSRSPVPSMKGADLDSLGEGGAGGAVAAARRSRHTEFSAPATLASGERMFTIAVPVIVADTVVGMVVGNVLVESIMTAVEYRLPDDPRRMVITSGPDTVASASSTSADVRSGEGVGLVNVPDGSTWRLHVTLAAASGRMRVALWGIGLAALATLVIGSIRERRQSRRIAERSQELEHLSTELLHANRAKSEFLANVSHELRTPLNAIVGFVDLLRDGVYGDLAPRQVGPVERIAASGTHLRHLVDQVLDLAKITAGRLEVHTDVVDLRAFVLDIAGEMEALVTERGLSLSLGIGTTLPRLRTDPTHLRQILVNLIGNAIKYTNNGSVSVRARLVGAEPTTWGDGRAGRVTPEGVPLQPVPAALTGVWIAIQVIDTGIGIAESDLDRIFDEFEQVGAGPRGESMQRGTGLGLSISRRLARLLGGDITVESQLRQGSTFTLWLPVDPADVRLAADRRSPPPSQPVAET